MYNISRGYQILGFILLAVFSGAILPLAFAPFSYYFLAEISILLLLIIWANSLPSRSFWYGWLFGLAFFGGGVYWVYISIHHYGNAPVILSAAIVVLLVMFLALYPAFVGYFLNKIFPTNNWQKFLVAFPVIWVFFEWVRGWFLSGFPWLFLGYSHIDTPLSGWAAVFGVYGVSFFIVQTAGAILSLFYYRKNKVVLICIVASTILIWALGFPLLKGTWTTQSKNPITVSLIQGNIPQEEKWKPSELWPIVNYYAYESVKNSKSDIIVWPEAAIPSYPADVWLYLKLVSFAAKRGKTTILSGIPFHDRKDNRYYNGILAFGEHDGRYYKRQLVPFGEYLPFRFALKWLHKYINIPMSDFSSGAIKQPDLIAGNGFIIAPFICYEIAYPRLVLDYLPRAELLVTVTDDSWFGKSIASAQHLEIARMRSLEVQRYQLFSTNTGISAVIDHHGKIIAKAPEFEKTVLTAEVRGVVGSTIWVRYGRYALLPLLLVGLWLIGRNR